MARFRGLVAVVRVMVVLASLLYVASWPGAALRPVLLELTAAPLPEDVADRDGALDVVVAGTDAVAVAGARVRAFAILDGRAHAAGDAFTDAEGRASLRSLPRAEHWIVAEAEGRARASQMVVIVSGARRLDLVLGVEHALDVVVKADATGANAPIAGAEIEVRGSDPFPVGARTDGEGRARVGRLGEGPFTVTVRAPGYEEITRRRVAEDAPCVITLGKQGALLVKVVSESGAPAAGARVLVASPALWPARVAETSEDGGVRIGGLDPGSYSLRAVKGANVSPLELGVLVARGEEKAIELRLAPGVMIAARVVDPQGGRALDDEEGIPRAQVTLAEGGLSPFPLEGLTDKHGRVVLGPIARVAATLSARADGFVSKGAVRVEDPAPPEVKIALLRGGSLVGRIVDTRGYAVDGATIRVVGTDLEGMPIDEDPQRASFRDAHFSVALAGPRPLLPAGQLGVMPGPVPPIPRGPALLGNLPPATPGQASADPWVSARDGTYKASPVSPGRVRVLVRHPQYVETMSDVVTLASEKEAKIDVVLSRGGSVEGRVVDTRGRPVAGAQVTALATRGSLERITRTGTDGSFAFASIPDALTLLVSRDDDATQVAARVEVAVPEGGKKSVEITLPEARPPLPVKVTTDRGAAIEAAQISAVSLDPSEALRVTAFTDRRGEAELASARGLAVRVEVRAPGRAAKIVVTTPEMPSLEVALATAESVTGEVWANRREPIDGAEVTLQTETGTRHTKTNKEGAYTLADLSPGPARLRVRAKGRAPSVRDVVVEDRGGRRATEIPKIELPEEGIVEGVVTDAKGDPVPGARVARDAVPTFLPASGLPPGMAVADGRGRFRLGELAEGNVVLEAYAPDVGRARVTGVRVIGGRTTDGVKIVIARGEGTPAEPLATGGVAVTLGETAPGVNAAEVVIVAVADGSEAERAGLAAFDVVVEVGGAPVRSITDARARLSGPVHDDVVVKIRRGERTLTLRVPREQVRR
ncbi:MAG: carboxypeptidase regulatory-like domain-containing protein [Labilithrix sp.]|nr:carboxypeptidase regulatory-like domain-containing protein [Labilithrix sp.]